MEQVILYTFPGHWSTTFPETNIAPKNGWLESYFQEAYFQGLY